MRHNTASQSRRSHGRGGGGGQYHNVLAVLGHVQKLSAILVIVVYLTMTMRWRTTSHDIEANQSYDMCAMVVLQRRTA